MDSSLEVVHERCCGLDVHKKSVMACILTPEDKEVRNFGTMTADLLELLDWVLSKKCSSVAMESTGVFWKPIYNLMETTDLEVMVVNAKNLKIVPGRKTDVKDAEWIAKLLQHGLLSASYIPDRDQRELRELVRYRRSLIGERTREINRIQKVLEGANIKLSSVISNINGVSGRDMLTAITQGVEDPKILSGFARKTMKQKTEQLEKALHGLIGLHQRKMLTKQLRHIDFLNEQLQELDAEIEVLTNPFEDDLKLLDTIPGVGRRTAEDIIAEIGTDMDRFPTAAHLCSWAGITPGNNESAGKRKSGKTRKGNKYLRATLVESARAASRAKNNYLEAQYHRLASKKGKNRAAVAVAHSILTMIYHMLKRRQPYAELGANYFEQRRKDLTVKHAVRKLESLGFSVKLEEIPA